MVKRYGIRLPALYVSRSNDMSRWLNARNVAFLLLSSGNVLQGRVLSLKSSMVSLWMRVVPCMKGGYFSFYVGLVPLVLEKKTRSADVRA